MQVQSTTCLTSACLPQGHRTCSTWFVADWASNLTSDAGCELSDRYLQATICAHFGSQTARAYSPSLSR